MLLGMIPDGSRSFRAAPRAKRALRIRMFGQDAVLAEGFWTVTRDVSAQGAFLRCTTPFSPGTRLRLALEAEAGEAPVEVEAEVKWCAPEGAEDPGVGVQFLAPPAALRRRLAEIQDQGELPVLEIFD